MILRQYPILAPHVPTECTVTVSINGIPVMTDASISPNHFVIVSSPAPNPGAVQATRPLRSR